MQSRLISAARQVRHVGCWARRCHRRSSRILFVGCRSKAGSGSNAARVERSPRSSQRPGCLACVCENSCPAFAPTILPMEMQGKLHLAVSLPLLPGNRIRGAVHLVESCSAQERGQGRCPRGGGGWSRPGRAVMLGAGRGMHSAGVTSVTQTTASPDLHTFPLPHCSRWMRPLQCHNKQKRKQISQSPAPLAAHEPSMLGMAAGTVGATGSFPCRATCTRYDPGPCRRRQGGAVDNPWLMFRCRRLLLFETIVPSLGSARCCSFPIDGKSPRASLGPGVSRVRCQRMAPPCFLLGCPRCSVLAVLLCAGSVFPAHSWREGRDPCCRAGRAISAGAASSTLRSATQSLLACKEPSEGDRNCCAEGRWVGQGISGSWNRLHPSLSWGSRHCLERGGSHSVKIWPPLHFPQIQFQGKMTLRQEKGGFSPGKKFKPHAGRLAAVAGGGTRAAREQALRSEAKRKVN